MSDSSAIQQQNDGPQSSGGRIRSKHPTDCQRGGNYGADSEDSSKPTGKWSVSKSKVNCYKFTFNEFVLICWLFQEKEITTGMSTAADLGWKEQCQNLLDILNRSDDSIPFRQPVNIEQVPHYPLVIDQRMDLQTVGEKLGTGHYATPSEFATDVRLIFENSKKFKPNTKSDIYKMTDRLSILFEDQFHYIVASYETWKTTGCKSFAELIYFN